MTSKNVASVVKHCDKRHALGNSNDITTVNSNRQFNNRNKNSKQTQINPSECKPGYMKPSIYALKRRPFNQFKKFGHWRDSHNSGGSLPNDVPAFHTPAKHIALILPKPKNKNANNCSERSQKHANLQ